MQNLNKIKVVGVGPTGETYYKKYILNADILVGGKRLLDFFKHSKVEEKIVLGKNLVETLENLKNKANDKNVVILASGDPLFFGIGKRLIQIFGRERLEFYPYLNSIQMLASKAKIDYSNIVFYSIHGREFLKEKFLSLVKYNEKVGILTDKKNNINLIINVLLNSNLECGNIEIVVGQMLGTENEKVYSFNLNNINEELKPSELDSVIVINRNIEKSYYLAVNEDEFFHTKSLITKKEIRAISLGFLKLNRDSVFWDIGGGSGSVSIEASSLCFNGKIFIIEKEASRVELIRENIKKFKCHNIEVVHGNATDLINRLPIPDRVFVGGFSGDIHEFLDILKMRNQGNLIVVFNIVIVEKLTAIINWCRDNNVNFEIVQVHVSNLASIGKDNYYFKSQNPINIVKVEFLT